MTKAQILAICRFTTDDSSHPRRAQVWFQRDCVMATDGHRLAVFGRELSRTTCTPSDSDGFGIEASVLRDAMRTVKSTDEIVISDFGVTVTHKDGPSTEVTDSVPAVTGDDMDSFPPIHKVIPWSNIDDRDRHASRGCPRINSRYLADAFRAPTLAGFEPDAEASIRCIAGADLDPYVCLADNPDGTRAIVVTMPVRD